MKQYKGDDFDLFVDCKKVQKNNNKIKLGAFPGLRGYKRGSQ